MLERGSCTLPVEVTVSRSTQAICPCQVDGVHRLSVDECVEIMGGVVDARLSDAEIAKQLGRDRTTLYREIRRNRNADGDYHAP